MSAITAAAVRRELKSCINPEKAAFFPRFFKSGPGEYAEGDKFLGVVVPDQRKIARKFRGLPRNELDRLLDDPYHECRLTGILILVNQFEKAKSDAVREEIVRYYLSRTDAVNNWDLVDSSAHKILGAWLVDRKEKQTTLDRLAKSKNLWEQRISVIATLPMIKQEDFDSTLRLANQFLNHPHDLIHKAVGWMLREIGNRNEKVLEAFLKRNASSMPRTMLRYSIEKLANGKRKKYLAMKTSIETTG